MFKKFLKNVWNANHHDLKTPTKLVFVVRNDLKMSKGKTAAQCAHAAVLCVQDAQINAGQVLKSWLKQGQPKVVLKVDGGYNELIYIQDIAKSQGVITALVRDAGRTQLAAGTATVLGIGPDICHKIDNVVSNLKLL